MSSDIEKVQHLIKRVADNSIEESKLRAQTEFKLLQEACVSTGSDISKISAEKLHEDGYIAGYLAAIGAVIDELDAWNIHLPKKAE